MVVDLSIAGRVIPTQHKAVRGVTRSAIGSAEARNLIAGEPSIKTPNCCAYRMPVYPVDSVDYT